jgi:hypothetical protein
LTKSIKNGIYFVIYIGGIILKKLILGLILSSLFLPNIFSQDKKHTLFVDFFPMVNGIVSGGIGLGIGYDYDINQYFAVGGYIIFVSNFSDTLSYNFILNGKYFPIKTEVGSPYIDLGLGYRRRKSDYDGSDNIHCLVGVSHIGWKFIFKNGLILDPAFGIRYDIATFSGDENFKFGYNIKAIVGWMF